MARINNTDLCESEGNRSDVLLSRFSALGDVAMTVGVVYDLCFANPERRFIFLTRRHPAALFINRPANLEICAVDTADYEGVSGIKRLYDRLCRDYDIGVYVDLHDVIRTRLLRLLFKLSGCKVTHVDKGRVARRRLTRSKSKRLQPLAAMAARYADAALRAGLRMERRFRSIFNDAPDSSLFAAAVSASQTAGNAATPEDIKRGERWIAVAPFARHEGKIYPAEKMGEVVRTLAEMPHTRMFVFGFGESEQKVIDGFGGGDNVVNMAALSIGLPAELALLAYCDVMLSMDSANMHLAALVGLRTVSVWGATHPYCGFRPEMLRDEDIVQLNMVCRPCSVFGQRKCRRGDYHCLHGITPARIVETVKHTLS